MRVNRVEHFVGSSVVHSKRVEIEFAKISVSWTSEELLWFFIQSVRLVEILSWFPSYFRSYQCLRGRIDFLQHQFMRKIVEFIMFNFFIVMNSTDDTRGIEKNCSGRSFSHSFNSIIKTLQLLSNWFCSTLQIRFSPQLTCSSLGFPHFINYVCFSAFAVASADFVSAFACLKAAIFTHASFLTTVLHFPMYFFWTTPVGRLLSRFSNDIRIIDERLAHNFEVLAFSSTQVCTE